jgi:hypothetical protein
MNNKLASFHNFDVVASGKQSRIENYGSRHRFRFAANRRMRVIAMRFMRLSYDQQLIEAYKAGAWGDCPRDVSLDDVADRIFFLETFAETVGAGASAIGYLAHLLRDGRGIDLGRITEEMLFHGRYPDPDLWFEALGDDFLGAGLALVTSHESGTYAVHVGRRQGLLVATSFIVVGPHEAASGLSYAGTVSWNPAGPEDADLTSDIEGPSARRMMSVVFALLNFAAWGPLRETDGPMRPVSFARRRRGLPASMRHRILDLPEATEPSVEIAS